MKRKQASQPEQARSKKSKLRYLQGSSKNDMTTRRSSQIKQMEFKLKQKCFRSDPDILCPESSSIVIRHNVKLLTGINKSDSKTMYVDVSPDHCRAVSLSDDEVDNVVQLQPRQNVLTSARESMALKNSHVLSDSQLDGSVSDDSVTSGPSILLSNLNSHRCSDCERLFSKMMKKGPLKNKKINNDPTSLSCDEWFLKKVWRPQRKHPVRGRLWVHLKLIRQQAIKGSDAVGRNTSWTFCSRPHVFLHRNLRRCSKNSRSLSASKVKLPCKWNHRAKPEWPPLSRKKRKTKSKSSEKICTSLYKTELQNKPATKDHHQDSEQQEKTVKKLSVTDLSSYLDNQTGCNGLEGTSRHFTFQSPYYNVEGRTKQRRQDLVRNHPGDKIHENSANATMRNCPSKMGNVLTEDVEGFWTPLDLCSMESTIQRHRQPSRSHGIHKDSFKSMLATLEMSHNQIIKESHH